MLDVATTPKVYISGPMSGIPKHNFPAFQTAAHALRDEGFEVVSPAELDEQSTEVIDDVEPGSPEWSAFLIRDIRYVLDVDAVVVLTGWEHSRGAKLEAYVAAGLGKRVYSFPGGGEIAPGELNRHKVLPHESMLEEAGRLVSSDRQQQYGPPSVDFQRSAKIMSALLGIEVTPEKVPLLMIAVKLSRIVQSPQKRDSMVDLIGYALTYEQTMAARGTPLE